MLLTSLRRLPTSFSSCLGYHSILRIRQCTSPRYQTPVFVHLGKRIANDVLPKKWIISPVLSSCYHKKTAKPPMTERENIWTIPNILCISRIAVSPYLGYLILSADFLQAFYVMLFAGFTDLLDGFIARNWYSQSSKLGSFLDPMADKILIVTMFATMTYSNLIPVFLTALIIVRDVSLVAAAFYIRYLSLPPPKTLTRYFDASLVTAQLAPTLISKFNTVVQLVTVAVTLSAPAFNFTDHPILPCLWCFTAVTTLASAASYIFSGNTYKILGSKPGKK